MAGITAHGKLLNWWPNKSMINNNKVKWVVPISLLYAGIFPEGESCKDPNVADGW